MSKTLTWFDDPYSKLATQAERDAYHLGYEAALKVAAEQQERLREVRDALEQEVFARSCAIGTLPQQAAVRKTAKALSILDTLIQQPKGGE